MPFVQCRGQSAWRWPRLSPSRTPSIQSIGRPCWLRFSTISTSNLFFPLPLPPLRPLTALWLLSSSLGPFSTPASLWSVPTLQPERAFLNKSVGTTLGSSPPSGFPPPQSETQSPCQGERSCAGLLADPAPATQASPPVLPPARLLSHGLCTLFSPSARNTLQRHRARPLTSTELFSSITTLKTTHSYPTLSLLVLPCTQHPQHSTYLFTVCFFPCECGALPTATIPAPGIEMNFFQTFLYNDCSIVIPAQVQWPFSCPGVLGWVPSLCIGESHMLTSMS